VNSERRCIERNNGGNNGDRTMPGTAVDGYNKKKDKERNDEK
jgi:hypothetical protein